MRREFFKTVILQDNKINFISEDNLRKFTFSVDGCTKYNSWTSVGAIEVWDNTFLTVFQNPKSSEVTKIFICGPEASDEDYYISNIALRLAHAFNFDKVFEENKEPSNKINADLIRKLAFLFDFALKDNAFRNKLLQTINFKYDTEIHKKVTILTERQRKFFQLCEEAFSENHPTANFWVSSLIKENAKNLLPGIEICPKVFSVSYGQISALAYWDKEPLLIIADGRRMRLGFAYDLLSNTAYVVHAYWRDKALRVLKYAANTLLAMLIFGDKLRAYLKEPQGLISPHSYETHIGHYLWNDLSGVEQVLELVGADGIGSVFIAPNHPEHFGRLDELFGELREKIVRGESPGAWLEQAFINNEISVKFGSKFIPERLAQRIIDTSRDRASPYTTNISDFMSETANAICILFGLRVGDRFWGRQADGYAMAIQQFIQHGFNVIAVFDGHNTGGAGRPIMARNSQLVQGETGSEAVFLTEERQVVTNVRAQLSKEINAGSVSIMDTLGHPVSDSIRAAELASFFISHWGAGLAKYKWVANAKGIIFSSKTSLNKPDVMIYEMPGVRENATQCIHLRDFERLHFFEESASNTANFDFDPAEFAMLVFEVAMSNGFLLKTANAHL